MNGTAYFDNAATTFPKPEEVYAFTDKFYRDYGVSIGRGQHKLAAKASTLVAETRELLLTFNHCPAKRVIFTHTATEALNMILRGLNLSNGSNVYVSPFEHNAVMRTLHNIAQNKNINIIALAVDEGNFNYNLEQIGYQFADKKPNFVVISHASNVCGIIAPIAEITSMSKRHGAVNIIDMCQTMGLVDTDLSGVNIDYAVFAGHKTLYAPLGVAGFICADDINIEPLLYGGTGIASASRELPKTVPERYEVGSTNTIAIAGLNAALKWLQNIGISEIFEFERRNHARLLEVLGEFDNIRIVPQAKRDSAIGVVSCVFDGYSSDSIGQILGTQDIAVRTGLHCAPDAHRFLGTFPSGTVRFSISYFNNEKDFEYLYDALEYIYENS